MKTLRSGGRWVAAVVLLSAPAVAFVAGHLLLTAPGEHLPEWVRLPGAWLVALTGIFGTLTTLAALVLTVVATFLRDVPARVKAVLWAAVALSVLALVYRLGVPP